MIEDFLKEKIGDITGFEIFFRFGAGTWFRFNLITGEHELVNRTDHWKRQMILLCDITNIGS